MKAYRKLLLRSLSLLLCFIILVPLLAACGEKREETEETSDAESSETSEPVKLDEKAVAIIVPSDCGNTLKEIADKVAKLCTDAGYTVSHYTDVPSVAKEKYAIQIGVSSEHLSELGSCGYGIKLDGNTLCLSATSDILLEKAYIMLFAGGLSSEGELFKNVTSKNVVYSDFLYIVNNGNVSMTVGGNTAADGVTAAVDAVASGIASIIKKQITLVEGNGADIVVIDSDTAVSMGVLSSVGYNECGIAVKNSKIYIYSNTSEGLLTAAKRFVEAVKDMSDYKNTKNILWPAELSEICSVDGVAPVLPYLESAQLYDAALAGSYTLCLTGEKQTFLDYADKVASLGYVLAEEHTKDCTYIGDSNTYTNIYRTYINDKFMVYMYFTDYKNTIRVVGASIDEYEALTVCEATDGNVDSTFTMLNTSDDDSGMSYAIRLSDGRFIVIDGGLWNSANEPTEVTRLYNWLCDNAVDGKPVIAAWILTHVHVDHVNIAWKFEQMYGTKVKIERYMHNFVNLDYLLAVDGTDLSESTYNIVYPRMTALFARYENSIFHTGQIYRIGNAEIDVVYTHEDLYPTPITYVNNTSTVMRITIEGNTILIAGDAQEDAQQIAVYNNGYTLNSDFVQMTHHGWNGLREYYRYAEAGSYTVALLPKNGGSMPNTTANNWLKSNADEFYMAADGIKTFALPYKK